MKKMHALVQFKFEANSESVADSVLHAALLRGIGGFRDRNDHRRPAATRVRSSEKLVLVTRARFAHPERADPLGCVGNGHDRGADDARYNKSRFSVQTQGRYVEAEPLYKRVSH